MTQVVQTNVLLLFTEMLAIPLDAHLTEEEDGGDMDDRALQALMEGARSQPTAPAPAPAPVVHRPTPRAPSVGSPKEKGKRKVDVDGQVTCVIESAASNNLDPDVVLELEESEQANKRGHVLIAIDNPNPDLDIKILVRTLAGRLLVYC